MTGLRVMLLDISNFEQIERGLNEINPFGLPHPNLATEVFNMRATVHGFKLAFDRWQTAVKVEAYPELHNGMRVVAGPSADPEKVKALRDSLAVVELIAVRDEVQSSLGVVKEILREFNARAKNCRARSEAA